VVLGEFLERQELFAHHHKVAECEWPGDERVAEATTGRVEDDAGDEPVAIRMARTA